MVALGGSGIPMPLICSPALSWSIASPEALAFVLTFVSLWSLAAGWLAMIVAMMLPNTVDALVHVRNRTLRRLRPACLALFLVGYVGVWMLAGAAFLGAAVTLRIASPGTVLPLAGATVVAAVWQISPWKQVALNRCHRRPSLAAFAPAACRDALAFGGSQGLWCLSSCWALMAMSLAAPASHSAVMALVAGLVWTERLEPATRPRWTVRLPGRTLRMISRIARTAIRGRSSSGTRSRDPSGERRSPPGRREWPASTGRTGREVRAEDLDLPAF